jgi:hypothetical protein
MLHTSIPAIFGHIKYRETLVVHILYLSKTSSLSPLLYEPGTMLRNLIITEKERNIFFPRRCCHRGRFSYREYERPPYCCTMTLHRSIVRGNRVSGECDYSQRRILKKKKKLLTYNPWWILTESSTINRSDEQWRRDFFTVCCHILFATLTSFLSTVMFL